MKKITPKILASYLALCFSLPAFAATSITENSPARVINVDEQKATLNLGYDDVQGKWKPAISHHGIVESLDYNDAIGLGVVSGHTGFRGFGQRSSLATTVTGDDVWTGTATTIPVPDQTVGDSITCVSTSANDAAAGSGAQQIDMHYITAAGAEAVQTITMNGVTPVPSGVTNVRHIQYLHTQRVALFAASAAGTITCYRAADAARIYVQINPGTNVSLNSQRMIPAGKTFYLKYLIVSAAASKPVSVRIRATADFEGIGTNGIFVYNEVFFLQDTALSINLAVPRAFPALSVIKATAYSATPGGDVSVSYGGFLE